MIVSIKIPKKQNKKPNHRLKTFGNSPNSKKNVTVNTMKNNNNKLVSLEDNLIINSVLENDVGAETKIIYPIN